MTEPWIASSGRPDGRQIALTFDDGPSGSTAAILEALAGVDARATFFVVGAWVERRPDDVRAVAARGHELGNHTWTHFDAREIRDPDVWRDEIARTSDVVASVAGARPRLFRPPYGAVPGRFARVAAECGLAATLMWSVSPNDWEGAGDDDRIVDDVGASVHPGAVVLLHDGRPGGTWNDGEPQAGTVRALPRILERLIADGYRFVTASELLAT